MARTGNKAEAKGTKAEISGTANPVTTVSTPPPSSAAVAKFDSFEIFERSIERASNLLKIHGAAHGKKSKPEKWLADAHRAAVVLAIAALDAFVRSFVITRIRDLLADKTAKLPDELEKKIKGFLKEDGLFLAARKDDLLERVAKAFRADFEKRSIQGDKQITESLQLVGFSDVIHEVAMSASENEDNLRKRLEDFTKRRHGIAHRGDYDLNQNPPKEVPITKRYAEDCIKLVSLIAKQINKLGTKS